MMKSPFLVDEISILARNNDLRKEKGVVKAVDKSTGPKQMRTHMNTELRPWLLVITGDFYGMRNIPCLWGDLLVLKTGITRAITADHPIELNPSHSDSGKSCEINYCFR